MDTYFRTEWLSVVITKMIVSECLKFCILKENQITLFLLELIYSYLSWGNKI